MSRSPSLVLVDARSVDRARLLARFSAVLVGGAIAVAAFAFFVMSMR